MPPRYAHVQASPSPPPVENDAQDILVIQDIMDTLDQIPPELTRVHSDLNELGAVLYSTLLSLENKLNTLIQWIQDPSVEPAERFQLLQEIAEEAARYKLGGDDKIRVAGGACDGIMAHQRHISNLLHSSTLLVQGPHSPYTQSLTLSQAPVYTSSRRGVARQVNSPFGGKGGNSGDTPTKKKKSRVQALGQDDDSGSVAGEKRKAPVKKRKPANRATSPADSLASASAFTGTKPTQPQTARQLAAAANRAKRAEKQEESDDESEDDDKEGGLGLDIGSREGSQVGGPTPTNGKSRGGRSILKRARGDDDDEDESEIGDDETRPTMTKRNGSSAKKTQNTSVAAAAAATASSLAYGYEDDQAELEETAGENEVDSKVYCTCRQVSYGEMIGCDDDDCEIEWYHLSCVGLDKTPDGNWICPQCVERRKRNPPKKRPAKNKPVARR